MEPLLSASGLQLLSEKKNNFEDAVTKVKLDNAGHMHTNMLTQTTRLLHRHSQNNVHARMRGTSFVGGKHMRTSAS